MRELQSQEIKDLVSALVKAQANVQHAFHDANNPHFKSNYATLESVIDAVKPAFLREGLVIVQQPSLDEAGKSVLITTVAHESGQWMRSFTEILNEKRTCQSMGSGITYARRYALAAMAGIGQTDDDGNEATEKPVGSTEVVHEPSLVKNSPAQINPEQGLINAKNFEITFGRKYKGQKAGSIPRAELEAYIKWLMASAVKDGTSLSEQVVTLKSAFERIYGKQEWK